MLRRQKNPAIAIQRLFQRTHARFAPHHKRGHHVREDHHLADGHHREFALSAVEKIAFVVSHKPPD